ncbi:MAG TPA: TldD/PmbA family protein [Oscillatoriaceae cyanobacterium M33_DOE_052]|uniref:TldD/PmbA family protein n=1 Tax=Planktothricoides sp. SpSt-374 TaxID=2282167 RepID=A0A7C3ZJD2_9CYAN|nr:TldD/PmbA family protein [Oscillatoriaceae cyanobacterium M33_DOE_052]
MTNFKEEQALDLIDSIVKQSKAEGVFISISAGESALSRFSENQITQNISRNQCKISITSAFGKCEATSSTSELDMDAILATIRRSEELARVAPEDPEWVPLVPPQTYEARTPGFDEATASFSPLERGKILQYVCQRSIKEGASGSGSLSTKTFLSAIGNSIGLRAAASYTEADFSFTARLDHGSSWCNHTAIAVGDLLVEEMTLETIAKARASRNPRSITVGSYPVVFTPAAFATLLQWVIWNLDARTADEGRSFMSRTDHTGKPDGNRIGEQLFSPLVQVQRHSAHPLLQLGTFFGDGLKNDYREIIKDGIPQSLSYSRYWAQAQGVEPRGAFYPIVMTGAAQSLEDIIASTEQGILVTRAWYVRYVNPRTLEVTGMTRDGTFWIENGAIAYPIQNLRFNQSLPQMLRDIDAIGIPQRCGNSVIPPVRVRQFNFTSVTDSV